MGRKKGGMLFFFFFFFFFSNMLCWSAFITFILTLKSGLYKYQFSQLSWTMVFFPFLFFSSSASLFSFLFFLSLFFSLFPLSSSFPLHFTSLRWPLLSLLEMWNWFWPTLSMVSSGLCFFFLFSFFFFLFSFPPFYFLQILLLVLMLTSFLLTILSLSFSLSLFLSLSLSLSLGLSSHLLWLFATIAWPISGLISSLLFPFLIFSQFKNKIFTPSL